VRRGAQPKNPPAIILAKRVITNACKRCPPGFGPAKVKVHHLHRSGASRPKFPRVQHRSAPALSGTVGVRGTHPLFLSRAAAHRPPRRPSGSHAIRSAGGAPPGAPRCPRCSSCPDLPGSVRSAVLVTNPRICFSIAAASRHRLAAAAASLLPRIPEGGDRPRHAFLAGSAPQNRGPTRAPVTTVRKASMKATQPRVTGGRARPLKK